MAKGKTPKLEQADGRDDKKQARSIDEILGNNKRRYRQNTVEEYQLHLKTLNLTDMQAHAQQVGLVPISDRKVLEGRLLREFKKTNNKFYGTEVREEPNMTLSDKAKQILAGGR